MKVCLAGATCWAAVTGVEFRAATLLVHVLCAAIAAPDGGELACLLP
jgi:hypothetical protein